MEPTDLDLIETDALMEALFHRFDCAVFAGMSITQDNHDGTGNDYAHHAWRGGTLTCTGLVAELQARIIQDRIGAGHD